MINIEAGKIGYKAMQVDKLGGWLETNSKLKVLDIKYGVNSFTDMGIAEGYVLVIWERIKKDNK